MALLEIENLQKYFDTSTGIVDSFFADPEKVKANDDVSLTVDRNDSIGVIGESGCGKSTLLKTLIGIHEPTGGEIRYRGKRFGDFTKTDWKEYRENVRIIFQDPYNTLDPNMTIRETLMEPLHIHGRENKDQKVRDALDRSELRPPENYLDRYPEQLSGGQRQRVSIARAIVLEPEILLADEPVSMLDVSTQSSILNLLLKLKDELDMSIVYISHDLSTVSYLCDTVNVMYLGRIVERATVDRLMEEPLHPYTQALIKALPVPNPYVEREENEVEGTPQSPVDLGEGCRFRDRCPERMDICEVTPREVTTDEGQSVTCHLHYDHEIDRDEPRSPEATTRE